MRSGRSWWIALALPAAVLVCAGAWLLREAAQQGRPVPVLMYHNLSADPGDDVWTVGIADFERHLQSLRAQGYRSILPEDLMRATRRRRLLPRKPVIITFDDGLLSVQEHAEPLLRRYGLRAIAYIISDRAAPEGEPRRTYRGDPCLTQAEVAGLEARGVLRIGGHGHTHARHPNVTAGETATNRQLLQEWTGARVHDFCYPYGAHPPVLVEAVRAVGFRTAMVCEDQVAVFRRDMDLLRIPRVSVFGGERNIQIERLLPDPEEGDDLVFRGRNDGLPLPVLPVLVSGRRRVPLDPPPVHPLGPEPQRWRWPRAVAGGGAEAAHVELWDVHRVLQLYP